MKNYSIQKILTPTELPQKEHAVTEWSAYLSDSFQAQLTLYNAVNSKETDSENTYDTVHSYKINKLFKSAMHRLRDLGNSLTLAHKVNYLVEISNDWNNLLRQLKDENADLMVTSMPAIGAKTSGQVSALMYKSPCPTLFVREGMMPMAPAKILVPVRYKDGLEQKIPAVIAWAKTFRASVLLSAFTPDNSPVQDKMKLYKTIENMANELEQAGVKTTNETVHGFHFGTTMMERVQSTDADMIVIGVEPKNLVSRLFTKMVGPYFLENSNVPVLSIPLLQSEGKQATDRQIIPSTGLMAEKPAVLPMVG